jgi:hypothetical protein
MQIQYTIEGMWTSNYLIATPQWSLLWK